jgi:Xaa-Pro aminopeptidase
MNRLAKIQQAMAERSVDLVILGPSSNLRYALGEGALATDRLTALLIARDAAVMVMPDFEAPEFVGATGFSNVATWADKSGPVPAVDAAFAKLASLPNEPVTLIDDELPFQFFSYLRRRTGADPGLASSLVGELRLIKDTAELQAIAETGELISAAIDFAQAEAQPARSELQLKRRLEEFLLDGGAETLDWVLVQAGANSAAPHHVADETVMTRNEPVLIDIAVRRNGYFADITQQVFLGEPPSEYRAAYEVVAEAQAAGVEAARAGAQVSAVAEAASAVIVGAGYGEFIGPRTGHGLGADVHEAPSVVEGNELRLMPGHVITVEPGIYVPGKFGIRIEDTVVIEAAGAARAVTRGARPLAVATSVS